MKIIPTALKDVLIIEPKVFEDRRGFFMETYHQNRYMKEGIDRIFVQDNLSYSAKNTVRGLHFQIRHPQAKRDQSLPPVTLALPVSYPKGDVMHPLAVLVQELPAVEGLARVDVICFDKTGTLTEGKLSVHEVQYLTETQDLIPALDMAGFSVSSGSACMSGSEQVSHVLLSMGGLPSSSVHWKSSER